MNNCQACERHNRIFIEISKGNKLLKERIEALEDLLTCYRLQKRPSEKLHSKLERTKQALEN